MSTDHSQSPVRRIASRLASIVAECNYAQRRMLELRLDPDRYVFGSAAPDTYAEFLARASGALIHEPAAADRQRLTR
ncbi:MAG TPA: hypothetical protein VK823_15720 [Streptosporangiaceae bacterium]|jgi:hypothetical protein|nr:hypothetical protein [Streptosporangiaceae bacterium]